MSAFGIKDMLLKTGEKFFYVADPNGSTGRGLKVIITGERKVDRVLKSKPLFVREQVAEGRVAECHSFVRAERLGAK